MAIGLFSSQGHIEDMALHRVANMYSLPVNCMVSDCGLWLSGRNLMENLMENEVLMLFAIKIKSLLDR